MDTSDATQELVKRAVQGLLRKGKVTGTTGTLVNVTVDGGALKLPKLASYTPTVGDNVHILAVLDGAWLIIGTSG